MDERSSECKRTDRACDMLEKGVVFLDGDVLVSATGAMRANLVMRRGFLVEFEQPLFDFQFNNVLEVPTGIGLMTINPVVCAELRQVCSSQVLGFGLRQSNHAPG